MKLNLNHSREQYFKDWSSRKIIDQFWEYDRAFFPDKHLDILEDQVLVGTSEQDLDGLLDEMYSLDSRQLVDRIEQSQDQLITLPPDYRIDSENARDILVYGTSHLVNLDSVHTKRQLLGEDTKSSYALSLKRKREHNWSPDRVIAAAVYHEQEQDRYESIHAGLRWQGLGNSPGNRVLSLYRCIQGIELKAFQNMAAYKVIPRRHKREVDQDSHYGTKQPLDEDQIRRRKQKVLKYESYIPKIEEFLNRLQVNAWDLIVDSRNEETNTARYGYGTSRRIRVPSLTRGKLFTQGQEIDRLYYMTELKGIPLRQDQDDAATWQIKGTCECHDNIFRKDRKKRSVTSTSDDAYFFCKHQIGAAWTLQSIYKDDSRRRIHDLPFPLPFKRTIEFVDKLRYSTIILDKTNIDNWTKRSLNHTEIENLLWKFVLQNGYENTFTTNIDTWKQDVKDPHISLLKFIE